MIEIHSSGRQEGIVEIDDFTGVELDQIQLSYFQQYFDSYFNNEFRYGQGTEDILAALDRFGKDGDWIDLGAGPSTLFWSIPLDGIRSVACCDVASEALKVLYRFANSDEVPRCYAQVLDMFGKSAAHLDEMKQRIHRYHVFNAMRAWPYKLVNHRYDLITELGLFSLAPSPERYLKCFEHLRPHLESSGRIVGADWVRSTAFIKEEGHDNSYLSRQLMAEGAERAGVELLSCTRSKIKDDPLYDAVFVWAMGARS